MTVPYGERRPRNGRTIKEAAQLTGLTEQTIKRWTSEPRETYIERAHKRQQSIREMRERGMTMRAIANQLNVSVGTVHYAIQKASQPPRQ
uniref:Uncharacterized protein n=1 Tax=uncultured prokaryote TaxID=198431 RepID=A0A0H5Q356_9ZZZZ|nr:hypothetical protein [uncultured prokaryote]